MSSRTFRSDNNAGLCPEALQALADAAAGHARGYGDDQWTDRAAKAVRSVLDDEAHVFFVATGTAANTLSVGALVEPWHRVVCHAHSHWNEDESTAPELFTGCRTTIIRSESDRLTVDDLEREARSGRGDVHQPAPGVVTISNPTEFGTIYEPAEVRALCAAAHDMGYAVHMDGARFANAVAAVLGDAASNASRDQIRRAARSITVDAGVDALSFGGTKNGLAMGEAVVFLPQAGGERAARAAERFPWLRKRAGHLLSKHRFCSAPFALTIESGAWIRHAARANAMAARLDDGLASLRIERPFTRRVNAVFARLPESLDAALRAAGHQYYPFASPVGTLARLMCSFDTEPADIDALLADAARARPAG